MIANIAMEKKPLQKNLLLEENKRGKKPNSKHPRLIQPISYTVVDQESLLQPMNLLVSPGITSCQRHSEPPVVVFSAPKSVFNSKHIMLITILSLNVSSGNS